MYNQSASNTLNLEKLSVKALFVWFYMDLILWSLKYFPFNSFKHLLCNFGVMCLCVFVFY